MKNILLPTDFSENSWNAIKYAIRFFENQNCNFYLLHIKSINATDYNDAPLILDRNEVDTLYLRPIKQDLQTLLKRIKKLESSKKSHHFYTIIENTYFTSGIRKTIDEKEIDFIVMGTKGATGLSKIILGSNTADVVTKVKCNTLVIPEHAKFTEPSKIAFPTDFSLSHNLHVLKPIVKILNRFKTSLHILHINKSKTNINTQQSQNKELLEEYFNQYHFSFHDLTNINVEDAIENFIENNTINMVCMVAKNLNYFQQILFHSKVENITYHTRIPFLVLHEKN